MRWRSASIRARRRPRWPVRARHRAPRPPAPSIGAFRPRRTASAFREARGRRARRHERGRRSPSARQPAQSQRKPVCCSQELGRPQPCGPSFCRSPLGPHPPLLRFTLPNPSGRSAGWKARSHFFVNAAAPSCKLHARSPAMSQVATSSSDFPPVRRSLGGRTTAKNVDRDWSVVDWAIACRR